MESSTTMYIQNKPAARQIQPIGFSGRLEAIRAPTRGKARKGKKINRLLKGPAVPQSLEGCVAGPMYKDETVSTAPAKNMATERAASDHASQEAARTLLPPPPCPCCLVSVVTTPLSEIAVVSPNISSGRPSGANFRGAALEKILAGEWSLARFV
jgi:hypothetical protein